MQWWCRTRCRHAGEGSSGGFVRIKTDALLLWNQQGATGTLQRQCHGIIVCSCPPHPHLLQYNVKHMVLGQVGAAREELGVSCGAK